ncbi:MAG: hypothetical protein ABIF19_06385 [Planctomycetota bacterium]
MSLTSNGIDSVRAFELPAGISSDGKCFNETRTALVKWRSSLQDALYQVYVNARYAGVTIDSEQRQLVVPIPTSLQSPVWIEVFAVEADHAHIDFASELVRPPTDSGRVLIRLLRSQDLPIDAAVQMYFDNGTGTIDYDNPLNTSPIRIWPSRQDKAGFTMAAFGLADFGCDAAAAIGFGRGCFGCGQFGLDADTIEWTSPELPSGTYKFGVKITDKSGNQGSTFETGPITVTPAARPAEKLSVSSFDKQMNQLLLAIADTE